MTKPNQGLAGVFAEAGRAIGQALEELPFSMAVHGALDHALTGDHTAAHQALSGLDEHQRAKVAGAARLLADVAGDVLPDAEPPAPAGPLTHQRVAADLSTAWALCDPGIRTPLVSDLADVTCRSCRKIREEADQKPA